MKKLIVLTTDLSKESYAAFDIAKEYAIALNAEINVITIVEDPAQAAMIYAMEFPVFPGVEIQKQLVDKVGKELEALVQSKLAGIEATITVVEAKGPIHAEITNYANEFGAHLVIIATHGRSGIKSLLIGSVAERVARHAACPVLVVPSTKA